MSYAIRIIRAKPNPAGKAGAGESPAPATLLGEWVDLQNTGTRPLPASSLHLADATFDAEGAIQEATRVYWKETGGPLRPGEILRVHAGRAKDAEAMAAIDRAGVHYHAYTESDRFVLNTEFGDHLSVWWKTPEGKWHQADKASYDPHPPVDKILRRNGEKLG